jgi:hypothetical protein
MRSIIKRLRDMLGSGKTKTIAPVAESEPARKPARPADTGPEEAVPRPTSDQEAAAYLDRVRAKLDRLAEDFNAGTINRAQFQNLYVHYQRELRNIETLVEMAPASAGWKGAVTEGQSLIIRQQHLARAEGYAVFENNSGIPLSTLGEFELDPALLVPMLSSYRAATREIFGAGTRSTEIEDGRWLCFVPGEFTTMLAVFSNEPAAKQLNYLEELHRHFERATRSQVSPAPLDPAEMVFPHQYFLGQWRR